jgi:hypothetical protein
MLEDGGRKYTTEKNRGVLWRRLKPTLGCNAKRKRRRRRRRRKGTWDSSVSIVTRLWAKWPGFNYWWGQWWDFSLHHPIHSSSGAETASYPVGTRAHTSGVKQPEHETDHSPPSTPEVKNEWSYTSTPTNMFSSHDAYLSKKCLYDMMLN